MDLEVFKQELIQALKAADTDVLPNKVIHTLINEVNQAGLSEDCALQPIDLFYIWPEQFYHFLGPKVVDIIAKYFPSEIPSRTLLVNPTELPDDLEFPCTIFYTESQEVVLDRPGEFTIVGPCKLKILQGFAHVHENTHPVEVCNEASASLYYGVKGVARDHAWVELYANAYLEAHDHAEVRTFDSSYVKVMDHAVVIPCHHSHVEVVSGHPVLNLRGHALVAVRNDSKHKAKPIIFSNENAYVLVYQQNAASVFMQSDYFNMNTVCRNDLLLERFIEYMRQRHAHCPNPYDEKIPNLDFSLTKIALENQLDSTAYQYVIRGLRSCSDMDELLNHFAYHAVEYSAQGVDAKFLLEHFSEEDLAKHHIYVNAERAQQNNGRAILFGNQQFKFGSQKMKEIHAFGHCFVRANCDHITTHQQCCAAGECSIDARDRSLFFAGCGDLVKMEDATMGYASYAKDVCTSGMSTLFFGHCETAQANDRSLIFVEYEGDFRKITNGEARIFQYESFNAENGKKPIDLKTGKEVRFTPTQLVARRDELDSAVKPKIRLKR